MIASALLATVIVGLGHPERGKDPAGQQADEPTTPSTSRLDHGEPASTSSSATTRPARSFSIVATGDLLVHTPVADQARTNGAGVGYDFGPMFGAVRPLLGEADLAICHIETPLSAGDEMISGYPLFSTPFELAADVAEAGYDTCSTASNHSLDQGFPGVRSTLDHLDQAGLAHAGTARTAEEARLPTLLGIDGASIAHLSYTYGTNGIPLPAEAPWAVNLIDAAAVLSDAAVARRAGAEFVVVSLQWGNEYQREPSPEQRDLARTLLGSPDIDLVIGHHAHVVQPVEEIDGEFVAYGLGNFLSNQSAAAGLPAETQDGVIVRFEVHEVEGGRFAVTRVSYTPTLVAHPGYLIRPADPSTDGASYQRTVEAITLLGPEAFDGQPTQ